MKIDNSGYIIKGILLLICGILFAFFPGVLSWIFYIIGGIIIIGSVLTGLKSFGGEGGSLLPVGIVGALIGLFVMYIPRFIVSKMSLIAGLILAVISITQIVKALSKELTKGLKISQLIFGIVLLVSSVFLIFNPFRGGKIIRFIVGMVMLAFAAFNFYVAYVINGQVITNNDIIDTNAHEVPDDTTQNRLQ